jgi:hypothetical protein
MAVRKPQGKSQHVSISKTKLAQTAGEMSEVAGIVAEEGKKEAAQGAARLAAAGDLQAESTVVFAKGASDLTRAVDEKVVADRMAILGEAVAIAGVMDIAEGAEMLAASDDVGVLSALVGMMSVEDIQHGLELARLSGELHTTGEMVAALKMPVLSTFLSERAARLHQMSVEQIRLAISTDGVSQVMAATGKRISTLGEKEVEEGMVRLTISNAVSEESAAKAKASEDLAQQGFEEMVVAGEVARAAREEAIEGAAEISAGSAAVGAAFAVNEVAATLKEKSE